MKKKGRILFGLGMLMAACQIGCGSDGGKTAAGESTAAAADSLLVYYVQGNGYYEEALASFQKRNQDVALELHAFDSGEELAQKYAAEGMSGDGADVVLLSADVELDMYRLMENGSCLALTDFLEENGVYDGEKYHATVLEAGQLDGEQYILPFTYDTGLILARDSVYTMTDTDFEHAGDFAAFAALLSEVQEKLYDSEEIRLSISTDVFDGPAEEYLSYLYRISGLDLMHMDMEAGREDVRAVCELSRNLKSEFADKYDEMKNSGSNSAYLIGYIGCSGNPASWLRFYELSMEYVTGETISFDGIPDLSGGYHATVRDCGFIHADSDKTEAACRLLQYILDYDYNAFQYTEHTGTPVNRANFTAQLTDIADWTKVKMGNQTISVSKMTDEHYEEVQAMEAAVSDAALINCEVEDIFGEAMAAYVDGTADFDTCYEQLKQRMKIYMQE